MISRRIDDVMWRDVAYVVAGSRADADPGFVSVVNCITPGP